MIWQNCAILEKWSQKDVNFKVYLSIVGFHMTSLKFKLQNYRVYWDFTFMVY